MTDEKIVYNRYSAILGKLRDDDVLTNEDLDNLMKNFIETGSLNGIDGVLPRIKAQAVRKLF